MRPSRKIKWLSVALLLLALSSVAGLTLNHVKSMRDQAEVAELTKNMNTLCIGRVLVDMPAQAEVRFSNLFVDGFAVSTLDEGEAAFRQRVSARQADFATGGESSVAVGPVPIVEARDTHAMGMIGRILVCRRKLEGTRNDDDSMLVELHAHTKNLTFTFFKAYTDLAHAKDAEFLLTLLHVRAKDEIPAVPGFCLERAVLVGEPSKFSFESGAVHVSVPGHPDLAVVLNGHPTIGDNTGVIGIGTYAHQKLVSASLHEDALIALWDRIASTVHLQKSELADAETADAAAVASSNRLWVASNEDFQVRPSFLDQTGTLP